MGNDQEDATLRFVRQIVKLLEERDSVCSSIHDQIWALKDKAKEMGILKRTINDFVRMARAGETPQYPADRAYREWKSVRDGTFNPSGS